ncbi:MAG: hypothetical protein CVU74_02970 [Deltaproteobacteria bacterium HGW-Deltaproteobacteria-9]|nr:MAG: hypothetical protein CVU74_02970 [Deltaproteobacteria bacterium HGW-Deltaproteobacteria-9]
MPRPVGGVLHSNQKTKKDIKMKAGVGYCNEKDAFVSGRNIAESAILNGKIEKPGLVLAFCAGQVNADDFFRGLRSIVGVEAPIIGGSAVGIITNDYLSYEGFPAGAAILQLDELQCKVVSVNDLDKDEKQAGRKLAEHFSSEIQGKLLLIFYDSIKFPPTSTTPPIMNASPTLIRGIEETFTQSVPIIGAGLVGDYDFCPTKQFCGSYVGSQSIVGALFGGDFQHYSQIMHGCTPKDGIYHTITKMEGSFIFEVDGKPIVNIIDDIYGNRHWQEQTPVKRLSIGVNHGERFGNYKEAEYVNRLITGVLPERKGIVIFEPDLNEGTEILFMLRDSQKMIESAQKNSMELMTRIKAEGREPVFGLYIDCAGRTASFSDTLTEEASAIRDVFNQSNIPLLGFYSGVEVAPLLGKSRGLDWTGVLLVLTKGEECVEQNKS